MAATASIGLSHADSDPVAGSDSKRAKAIAHAVGKNSQLAVRDASLFRLDDGNTLR
jgi:hypothetical protein